MGDERVENPTGGHYFDELHARIHEIRASVQSFYQKVRDLFALSIDYQTSIMKLNAHKRYDVFGVQCRAA